MIRSRSLPAFPRVLVWTCLLAMFASPAPSRALSYEKGEVSADLTGFAEANVTIPLWRNTPQEDPSALVEVEGELDIGEHFRAKLSPRLSYDGTVRDPRDWNPLESFREVYPGKPLLLELNEAYLQYSERYWDLKAGIQRVVWGVLDEFNPVDNLNPQDFSKFVTFKKLDRKIGIPMVKLDLFPPVLDLTVEAVWVPVFVPYRMPRPGERWFPPIYYLPPTVDVGLPGIPPVQLHENAPEPDLPPVTFENSEAALRISKTIRGMDLAVSYFYGFDTQEPVFRGEGWLDVSLSGFPPQLQPSYTIDLIPRFDPVSVWGISLSTAVSSFTIRTEWAYTKGRYHTVNIDLDSVLGTVEIPSVDEITRQVLDHRIKTGQARALFRVDPVLSLKRDAVDGGVGVDYIWGNHLITAQVLLNYISDYDPRLMADEFEVIGVVNFRFSWLDDSLNADLAAMYNFSDLSLVLTPEVSYRFTSAIKGSVRLLYIDGPLDTFVGQYSKNDQIQLRVRYSF